MIADTAGSHNFTPSATHRLTIAVRLHEHHFGMWHHRRHRVNRFQYME